ncbi:hypothetical protein BA893_24385 [Vibrio natriegens]|jgi:hypothetical protein|uniref:DUF4810 domain-containing protein n=1 Tax=Vibrio TaxID=662 RepID=UPI000243BC05|nr:MULTISPECIES: DUF4810 domain-containing protein [Vibrio]AEX25017.1 lipoprotein [Vibrio sp. EJY3]ANQ24729.1 hypothetical protein BA893_24385 [Vibrio natriegens]MCY9876423.1 DUF4810 domain-containing protein [Vibrio natriegens]MEE3877353.1 DUF4810 domain-containing protein [Vibrio sp. YYF0003]
MHKLYKSIVVMLFITLTGCAHQVSESGYYWGTYSDTYYAYLENPSKETAEQHFSSLTDIVKVSDEKGLKCPPGIYAEMAYIKQKQGNNQEAKDFYNQELQLYPESKTFVEKLFVKGN